MRRLALIAIVVIHGTFQGCAGGQPAVTDKDPAKLPSLATAPASSGVHHLTKYNAALASMEQGQQSTLDRASSAVKQATSSIKESLTIHPKVVAAKDPLALDGEVSKISPHVFFSLATVYERQGKLSLAVQQFKKGIEADPESPVGWIKFARMYDRQGDFRQASRAYERALELSPDNTTALNDLGLSTARQGDFGKAIPLLEKASSIRPQKDLYRNNLATVLVAAGRTNDGFRHLQAVHPPAQAHYNLAILLLKENRRDEAVQHLRHSLGVDPGFALANQLLTSLDRQQKGRVANRSQFGQPQVAPGGRVQPATPQQNGLQHSGAGQREQSNYRPRHGQPNRPYAGPSNNAEAAPRWNDPSAQRPFMQSPVVQPEAATGSQSRQEMRPGQRAPVTTAPTINIGPGQYPYPG